MLKRNNRRAIAVLVAALAVVVLLLIHGFSSCGARRVFAIGGQRIEVPRLVIVVTVCDESVFVPQSFARIERAAPPEAGWRVQRLLRRCREVAGVLDRSAQVGLD